MAHLVLPVSHAFGRCLWIDARRVAISIQLALLGCAEDGVHPGETRGWIQIVQGPDGALEAVGPRQTFHHRPNHALAQAERQALISTGPLFAVVAAIAGPGLVYPLTGEHHLH